MSSTSFTVRACITGADGHPLRDTEGRCYHQLLTWKQTGTLWTGDATIVPNTSLSADTPLDCDHSCDICQTRLPRDISETVFLAQGQCLACRACKETYERLADTEVVCIECDKPGPVAALNRGTYTAYLCRLCLVDEVPEAHKAAVSTL